MKNKFPKLNDALFQDEQLNKTALSSVVGGVGGTTYRATSATLNSYDSQGVLRDSRTGSDQEAWDEHC